MAIGGLAIELGANTVTLQSDLDRATGMVGKAVADINVSINRVGTGADFSGVSSQLESLKASFSSLQTLAASVFGVGIGAGGVRQIMEIADAYQGVTNRIITTTSSMSELANVQAGLFSVAQETGVELDNTAKTYQRLEQVIQGAGRSQLEAQTEAVALTKTLNEEIALSGSNIAESTRAVQDLVHGLASGTLNMRQFRGVMMQMPDLTRRIADGLGVSQTKLFEMMHAGLSTQQVLEALSKESATISQDFSKLPVTFARAWTVLHNALEQYVGQASQASALSNGIKDAIMGVANNIGVFVTAAEAAGVAMAAWLGGKVLQSIGAMGESLRDAVLAQGAYKTAAIQSAEADAVLAVARQKTAAATLEQAVAQNDLRLADEAEAAAKLKALTAERALLEARLQGLPVGVNIIAESQRLEAVQVELAAAETRLTTANVALAASFDRVAAAEAATIATSTEATAATGALTAAKTAATSATGLLSRAGGALFAAVGGWTTVIIGAAVATYSWVTNTTDLSGAITDLNNKTAQQTVGTVSLESAIRGLLAGEVARKTSIEDITHAQREAAQAELDHLEAQRDQAIQVAKLSGSYASLIPLIAAYAAKIYYAKGKIDELDQAQAKLDFTTFTNKVAGAVGTLQRMFGLIDNVSRTTPDLAAANEKAAEAMDKLDKSAAKHVATLGMSKAATVEWERAQDLAAKTAGLTGQALEDETAFVYKLWQNQIDAAQAEDAFTAAKKEGASASKEAAAAARQHAQDEATLASILQKAAAAMQAADTLAASLAEGLGGPYLAAQTKFNKEIETFETALAAANTELANGVITQAQYSEKVAEYTQGEQDAAKALDETNQALKEKNDIIEQQTAKLESVINASQTLGIAQKAELETDRQIAAALKAGHDLYGVRISDLQTLTATQRSILLQINTAIGENEAAMKRNQQVMQEWQRIAENGFQSVASTLAQFASGGIKTWHDFGQALIGDAKSFIAQIIEQFLKLTVINGLMNSLFGSNLPTASFGTALQGLFGGGMASGGGFAGAMGGGSGLGNQFSSGLGLANTAYKGFEGFQTGGFSGAWNSIMGGGTAAAGATAGMGGYAGSMSQALGITDWGAAAGTASTAAGTASTAASGFASAMSTFVSWIPVIGLIVMGMSEADKLYHQGWKPNTGMDYSAIGSNPIAGLAAPGAFVTTNDYKMLRKIGVNSAIANILTGAAIADRFFGHKKPELVDGSETINFDPSKGASGFTDANILSKGGFFSSDKRWTQHDKLTSDDLSGANAFIDILNKSTQEFAKQFGVTMADAVGGTFKQEFDKAGKATGVTTSTINGQTYKNETQDQFQQRLITESDLKVLTTFDKALDASVQKYRANVDTLTGVVNALAGVESILQSGGKFLAAGSNQTLSAILKLAEGMQKVGETIDQTLARISQSQAAYDQFVAQFKPQTVYVDDFEMAMAKVRDAMLANIKQANDLAKAAGAEGAAVEDLANIHAQAAAQMAALVMQLEASAQSLAFSLGITTQGSLSQVDAEIARLQGQTKTATSAVSNFGSAITSTAAAANNAILLLIGNLSPLNDAQKLQIALQGQREGTVTPDQVLQIGRQLYASSQAYVNLFAEVQAIGDHTQKGSVGGSSSGSSSTALATGSGLSKADQARLDELLKERDMLQASQTLGQYKTLAQQIAEIASAKGITFQQVMKEMGIKQADLEKGLGIKSDAELATYIANIQKQTDSNKDNTKSIVNVLNNILNAIIRDKNAIDGHGLPTGGHSTHGKMTPTDVGNAIGDAINRRLNNDRPRSSRGVLVP